jgi:ankyrin repeat protein
MTPLHKAAVNGHAAMAKLLINNGAKLTVNDDIDG